MRAVHNAGGRIALQLWHGGRVACDRLPAPQLALSPSGVDDDLDAINAWGLGPEGRFVKLKATPSRAMTLEEIRRTIEAFGEAARACREIGFDAIELHGANGYLPHQFLSPHLNRREDEYGGSPEKRARFALDVLRAMMRHYPPVRVGLRISPFTDYNGAIDPDPALGPSPPHSRGQPPRNGMDRACRYQFLVGEVRTHAHAGAGAPGIDGRIIANGGIDPGPPMR